MSHDASKDTELLEKDVSANNHNIRFVWPFRTKEKIQHFLNAKARDGFRSVQFCIKIENDVMVDWMIDCYPNGIGSEKNPEGYTKLWLQLNQIPKSKTMEIVQIMTTWSFEIPEIFYRHAHKINGNNQAQAPFPADSGSMRWGLPCKHLKLETFNKFNVLQNNGFDIICSVKIHKIKYFAKPVAKSYSIPQNITSLNSQNMDMNVVTKMMDEMKININNILKQIQQIDNNTNNVETKLGLLNNSMNDIKTQINKIGDSLSKDDEKSDLNGLGYNNKQIKPATLYLKQWIYSLFNGNDELVKNYTKLIVEEEGFEDLNTFMEMSDNDLKDMGINKKAHRIKFIKGFNSYNASIAMKMADNNQLEGQFISSTVV